jgi:hypothetical protein
VGVNLLPKSNFALFVYIFKGAMGQARDWSAFLSEDSKAREPSPLKAVANHLSIPGIISSEPRVFPF